MWFGTDNAIQLFIQTVHSIDDVEKKLIFFVPFSERKGYVTAERKLKVCAIKPIRNERLNFQAFRCSDRRLLQVIKVTSPDMRLNVVSLSTNTQWT